MPTIEVLAGGVQSTVQDLGRPGFRASGVPTGGAMDRFALAAANLLVGNEEGSAGLEILLGGLALVFRAPAAICVAGADLGAVIDGESAGLWAYLAIATGQELRFTTRRSGARAYLAVAGGLDVAPILHSRSTYLPGGWGGYRGRPLRVGDTLDAGDTPGRGAAGRWLPPEQRPVYSAFPTLRCVLGPHREHFPFRAVETLLSETYTLDPACDRMGYRLRGQALSGTRTSSLPSGGVVPGVLQVLPEGGPILLMADAQTTGGYPIIATVIGADLPLAAQLVPGDRIRFMAVTAEAAISAARARRADLTALEEDPDVEGAPI